MMQLDDVELLKLAVELARALAWPAIFVVLVALFSRPLRILVNALAERSAAASKFSFGGLSIEIEAKARQTGNAELATQIGALSPSEVEQLLRTPPSGGKSLVAWANLESIRGLYLPTPDAIDAFAKLSAKGFIAFQGPLAPFVDAIRKLPLATGGTTSNVIGYISPYEPSSDEERQIFQMTYALTDKGRRAVDAIVRAVAAQLTER